VGPEGGHACHLLVLGSSLEINASERTRSSRSSAQLEVAIDQRFVLQVLHTCAVDHCCLQTARARLQTTINLNSHFRFDSVLPNIP
jgi:hypothetical protein